MTIGVIGRKAGMTRVFTEDGATVPVTVIEVQPNRVTQVKTGDTDGYRAVQVTAGARKASRVNKPEAGHFRKAGVEAGDLLGSFDSTMARVRSSQMARRSPSVSSRSGRRSMCAA